MIELLYQALYSPLGIVVESESPERLRQKLYPLRKEREELSCLSFVISPTNPATDLWIIKQGNSNGSE